MVEIFATVEDAAHVFDTGLSTIYNWINDGTLPTAPRVGRKHRIPVRAIAELAGLSVEEVREVIKNRRDGRGFSGGILDTNKAGLLSAAA